MAALIQLVMTFVVNTVLIGGVPCGLAYLKEINRLECGEAPNESGKKLILLGAGALVFSFVLALFSADAGLIFFTLAFILFAVVVGIAVGHWCAWKIYCRRNPDMAEEE